MVGFTRSAELAVASAGWCPQDDQAPIPYAGHTVHGESMGSLRKIELGKKNCQSVTFFGMQIAGPDAILHQKNLS